MSCFRALDNEAPYYNNNNTSLSSSCAVFRVLCSALRFELDLCGVVTIPFLTTTPHQGENDPLR